MPTECEDDLAFLCALAVVTGVGEAARRFAKVDGALTLRERAPTAAARSAAGWSTPAPVTPT